MSLSTTVSRIDYIGNDATSIYDFTFKIFAATDLLVTVKDTLGTETILINATDYAVTGINDTDGGSINLNVGSNRGWLTTDTYFLKQDYILVIRRVRPLTQTTDIRNQGAFYPEIHENAFDHFIMIDQQQQNEIDRSLKLPESVEPSAFSMTLPADMSDRIGQALVVNDAGDGISTIQTTSLQTIPPHLVIGGSGIAADLKLYPFLGNPNTGYLHVRVLDQSPGNEIDLRFSNQAGIKTITVPRITSDGEFVMTNPNTSQILSNVERVYIADGTVTIPTFAFKNDTNLGIYRISADKLGITTAGVLRVSIDSIGSIVNEMDSADPNTGAISNLTLLNKNATSTASAVLTFNTNQGGTANRRSRIYVDLDGTNGGKLTVDVRDSAGSVWNNAIIIDNTGKMMLAQSPNVPGINNSGAWGFRNRLFNGDMRISQRRLNNAATISVASFIPILDMWSAYGQAADGVFTVTRQASSNNMPHFMRVVATTADASIGAAQIYVLQTCIEGYNISDFYWGTSDAKAVTLSFWVRSSLTGTFSGAIKNSATNRAYPFSFVINSVSTWEYKTITIPGDTTGTWVKDFGIGLRIYFDLGCGTSLRSTSGSWQAGDYMGVTGAVQVIGTLNASFDIGEVQLEIGSVATAFEQRPLGQELTLCKRYFEKSYTQDQAIGTVDGLGAIYLTDPVAAGQFHIKMQVNKRANPTVLTYSIATGTSGVYRDQTSGADFSTTVDNIGTDGARVAFSTSGAAGENKAFQWTAASELI